MSSDVSALRRVLAADPLAATEQIRHQLPDLQMSDATIDVFRYRIVRLLVDMSEAGHLTERGHRLLPRLKRWARDYERRHDSGFLEGLSVAWGVVERGGEGSSPKPLAEYIAAEPLTDDARLVLADFISRLPSRMPHGVRGEGKTKRDAITQGEHRVARRVQDRLRQWREQHEKAKVPAGLTEQYIGEEMDEEMDANPERVLWRAEGLRGRSMVQVRLLLKNPARLK